jgi:SOS-response transcriptional repressor LexA
MPVTQHHFGDDSQEARTNLVIFNNTNLVPNAVMTSQKYPNGLAAAMRARPKVTQADLARAADTSPQQINRLLQGEREMTAIWAEKLAPALNTAPEVLVFPQLRRVRAPVLSWVSAGRMAQQESVKKADIKQYLLLDGLPKGDWVVLEVEGDSMDRIAPDGSYICVNLANQRAVNDGFFVFSTPDGEATFKRYREGKPPRLQPFSTNPDHETQQLRDGMQIFGRVGRVINDLV